MFTFEVLPGDLFEERAPQFARWGIPKPVIAQARREIRDMWGMGADGWVPVWARHAEQAVREGEWLRAALCWGAARFPSLATVDRQFAYEQQLECYRQAVPRFPLHFERRVLEIPLGNGTTTPVPVHFFQRHRGRPRGILVASGGVDTWKVELHRLWVSTALATGLIVAALDMPGTGESAVPLAPGSDRVLAGVVELLRAERRLPVAYLGLSFGGHWAAKLALRGQVDAGVDIGGPTGAAGDRIDVLRLPYGMTGIIGNAMDMQEMPDAETAAELLDAFSLRRQGLLDGPAASPLLAVNGANDQYVPRGDTTGLAAAGGTVWVVRGATHCAPERFAPMILASWGWLLRTLNPARRAGRLTEQALRLPLRPLLMAT